MRATGRPFDTSKQLNLADLDTRQVLGSWVMNRARAGEQPQAGMATQIGPGSPPPSGPAGALAQGQSAVRSARRGRCTTRTTTAAADATAAPSATRRSSTTGTATDGAATSTNGVDPANRAG